MRLLLMLAALTIVTRASALPDDSLLSRRLVGMWHDFRHDTRYFADGTYLTDPGEKTSPHRSGKWKIVSGELIQIWRSIGASEDSRVVQRIIQLDQHVLRFRTLSQTGPFTPVGRVFPSQIFTLTRKHSDDDQRPNQAMQPTTGRRTTWISMTPTSHPAATRALASGG